MMRAFARFHHSHFIHCTRSMPSPALSLRKKPQQARAAAMLELILQGAARVLRTQSLAGFTTNRVAEIAGISVGSLYQYFPNKSALVAALIQREQAALCEAVVACAARHGAEPLPQVVARWIDIAVHHQFGDAVYAAAIDHEERRLPLQDLLGAAQQSMVQAVAAVLRRHGPAFSARQSVIAAQDCLVIAKALIESEPPDVADAKRRALKKRVLRALLGYLKFEDVR